MSAKKLLTAGLSLAILGLTTPSLIHAENMRSDSYIIQFGNFNMTSGEKSSAGYKVTDTVGQTAPGEYASTGYRVFAGFQYIYAIPKFSFRITSLSVDFGELQDGVFTDRTHDLIVTTRSGGYSILSRAEGPLQRTNALSGAFIPFTSCDAGCTPTTALPWTLNTAVGWGFNASGSNRAVDFVNSTYYRPFADKSQNEAAQVVATSSNVVKGATISITYRATISPLQEAGDYQTSVEYTAIPTF